MENTAQLRAFHDALFQGLMFRFYFDGDGQLHALRHGIGVPGILEAFFEGSCTWNEDRNRWQSRTGYANAVLGLV